MGKSETYALEIVGNELWQDVGRYFLTSTLHWWVSRSSANLFSFSIALPSRHRAIYTADIHSLERIRSGIGKNIAPVTPNSTTPLSLGSGLGPPRKLSIGTTASAMSITLPQQRITSAGTMAWNFLWRAPHPPPVMAPRASFLAPTSGTIPFHPAKKILCMLSSGLEMHS